MVQDGRGMTGLGLLVAFLAAAVLTALFVGPLRVRRPGAREEEGLLATILFFFGIVLVASWAGGLWLSRVGAYAWGARWLGYVAIAVITAVLLAVASPRRGETIRPDPVGRDPHATGVWLWGIMAMLTIAVLVALA